MARKVFCDNCKFCVHYPRRWNTRCNHPDNTSIRYTPEKIEFDYGDIAEYNGLNNCKSYRFSVIGLIDRCLSKLF